MKLKLSLFILLTILVTACGTRTRNTSAYALIIGAGRGKLFFGHSVVYVVDEYGSSLNLDILEKLGRDAQWSPDGQWIVHRSYNPSANSTNIFLMGTDNGQIVQLTNDPASTFAPSWSPGGTQIAFYAYDVKLREFAIYLLKVECILQGEICTPKPTFLTSGVDPDWSPDGKKIVFRGLRREISVIDIQNPDQVINISQGLTACYSPQWSPDGMKIAFACNEGIYLVNPDGGNSIRLPITALYLRWSPDGEKIAFIGTEELDPELGQVLDLEGMVTSTAVFIMDANGTNVERLTYSNEESISWLTWVSTDILETKH